MNSHTSAYISKPVDENGDVAYTEEENHVWSNLITEHHATIINRACPEYLYGLTLLNLSHDHIPQCAEISEILLSTTGWSLEPVPAIIPPNHFFYLLSQRKFPAATFIRRRDELHYVKEPDIFHEIVGHCPLLTNPAYANFTYAYGQLGLRATEEERALLAGLYWFTIEFGLIKTRMGTRAYGGGILSSINEIRYSIDSDAPKRRRFDLMEVLRTPYRIDIMQPVYYVIEDFQTLFDLTQIDLLSKVHEAVSLGMNTPEFPVE